MAYGIIARLRADRGFGFIRHNDTKREYFFHCKEDLAPHMNFAALVEGDRVQFDVAPSPKGEKAVRVEYQ